MRIQHNIMAMNAYRNYNTNTSALSKNLEKLSSGYKINRAGDDAAGLAISEKMRAQITGLNTAQKNVKDGISLVKTAEGAMQEVQDMLNRMVDLATQSANGTYQDEVDREALQAEIDQLNSEIDRIADSANFNGIKLLDGSLSKNGGTGATSKFTLPPEGTALRTNTVLHTDDSSSVTGTEFSVDLHNLKITDGSGATFTLTIGNDITIELTGTASAASAQNYTGAQIVDLLSGSAAPAGFTVTVNGVAAGTSASSAVTFGSNGLTIKSVGSYGAVNVTKGAGGDARLTFTQAQSPSGAIKAWEPASQVNVRFQVGGVTPHAAQTLSSEANFDNLISNQDLAGHVIVPANIAPATKVDLGGGTPAAATIANSTSLTITKPAGTKAVTNLDTITITLASSGNGIKAAALEKNVSGTAALKVNITASGAVKLMAGTTVLGTASTAITSDIATSGNQVFNIKNGSTALATVTITADSNGPVAATQLKSVGELTVGTAQVKVTAAVPGDTGDIVLGSGGGLITGDDAFASAVAGEVKLVKGTSGNNWKITIGSKTLAVTASYASTGGVTTVNFKAAADGNPLVTITASGTTAAIKTKLEGVSGGISLGQFTPASESVDPPADSVLGSNAAAVASTVRNATTASAVKTALASAGLTAGSTTTVTASTAAPAITNMNWVATSGSVAKASFASASVSLTINGTPISVDLASIANSMASTTAGKIDVADFKQAVLDKLQAEANKVTAAQVAANATTITVYSNFRFDGDDTITSHADNTVTGIKYDVTTYSNVKTNNNTNGGNSAQYAEYDYNVSTTNIKRVDADGKGRLASTRFEVDSKKVINGAKIRIGTEEYIFSTNKADWDVANHESVSGKVYIGDLVDENGALKDDAAYAEAMERLTRSAKDNQTYTVGFDGEQISVTEKVSWGNQEKDGAFDLETMEGVEKSLGFTAAGAAAANGGKGLTLQIGDTSESFNQLSVEIDDIHAAALGVGGLSIATQKDAADAIDTIKKAINTVSSVRGRLGATQNRLEHTQNNLSVMAENIQDAESSIRDTDIAEEMMAYTKNNILVQSAQAMLAQANQVPQGVLQLLG